MRFSRGWGQKTTKVLCCRLGDKRICERGTYIRMSSKDNKWETSHGTYNCSYDCTYDAMNYTYARAYYMYKTNIFRVVLDSLVQHLT